MILQPIVEGQGDEAAVPVLLRRLAEEAQAWNMRVARPHRRRRTQLVQKDTLQTAVKVARLTPECRAILILFDADDDCPMDLAPKLAKWARDAAGNIPSAIVMANREYEAWFLAGIESLRGQAGIRLDATAHAEPENPRDAKGELERRMRPGTGYSPTVDQAPLTARLDLAGAYRRCRSFRKLVKAFDELIGSARAANRPWPPEGWIAG